MSIEKIVAVFFYAVPGVNVRTRDGLWIRDGKETEFVRDIRDFQRGETRLGSERSKN